MDKIKLQIPVLITKFVDVEIPLSEAEIINIGKDLQNPSNVKNFDLDLCDSDDFIEVLEENTGLDIHEKVSKQLGNDVTTNWQIDDILDYEIIQLFPTVDDYYTFKTELNHLTTWENP